MKPFPPQLCRFTTALSLFGILSGPALARQAQSEHHHPTVLKVPLQPLAQHVRRVQTTLDYLGQPFTASEQRDINEAIAAAEEGVAVQKLQDVLDKHVLAVVEINPESRVKVSQGAARPDVAQAGTRLFLVKVVNQAGITSPLVVESPNSGPVSLPSRTSGGSPEPPMRVTPADVRDRWAEISLYTKAPMREKLSGLGIEYAVLQVFSRDTGQRSAVLRFHVGQGTEDLGFRSELDVLFQAAPAYPVRLHVRDENDKPATAALVIRDALSRIYPNPSKRLAPDLPFQPQIYRADGETVLLPPGVYTVTASRGPEYLTLAKELNVSGPGELSMSLRRWIDPSKQGWYSGDHHIHAAGCSHYENPTQGVQPRDMWAQILGEALNVGCVLTWGPCYYYQKQFFSGQDHPLSTADQLIHYDLEVSGFPSSHAGHLVLLGLKEQDYPGTRRIEDWPSWDWPILRWGKGQGAVTGFAHSGWGLEVKTTRLPNYEMPGFDGIGANEYIVDVTTPQTVDFISAGDTPIISELNIWYHTLNSGFRARISGETDFPCITDEKVGQGRSYAKVDGRLTYAGFVNAIRDGRTYVSDGKSHLMDFRVNGNGVGTGGSELKLAGPETVKVDASVAAYLENHPDPVVARLPLDQKPYWSLERARISGGTGREVPVEVVVNGQVVAKRNILADGKIQNVHFDIPIKKSSWVALRIFPSSHTNPVFVLVGDKPIRASRRSAEWCLAAVNQCWTQKAPKISAAELDQARKAYDAAREVYRKIIAESEEP
ncbi:MAG TPA: CehA/McbA family metallohydrolase [Acidobacteriota bacterium]|jgi:hypothetical protein